VNRSILNNISLDLAGIHVRGVLGRGTDSMVFTNERIEDRGEVFVRIPITGIDTTVLVIKLHGTGNGLNQGKSRCLGLDILQLLPNVLCNMLGY